MKLKTLTVKGNRKACSPSTYRLTMSSTSSSPVRRSPRKAKPRPVNSQPDVSIRPSLEQFKLKSEPTTPTRAKRTLSQDSDFTVVAKRQRTASVKVSSVKQDTEYMPPSPKSRDGSQSLPSSPSKPKAKKGYAPPAKYAHLDPLSDHIQPELDGVFFCC